MQSPAWHVSLCVHALPSLQAVPFAADGFEQVPVAVLHAKGEQVVHVNQRISPEESGLGLFFFTTQQPAVVEVRAHEATPGHVILDAVQLVEAP